MSLKIIFLLTIIAFCACKDLNNKSEAGLKYKYGGRHPIPVDNQHIVNVSNWAAEKLGGRLRKITHAEEQVVSGLMYYIDMNVAFRNYERRCSVKVWTQEWRHSRKLVHSWCKKKCE